MQWDDSENAGFTTGKPWINVNPNYKKINDKEQLTREDSVFNYYKKLISLRKEHEIIVYGDYELLLPDDEDLFVYLRRLNNNIILVACNFSENTRKFDYNDIGNGRILINNYKDINLNDMKLRPFEAFAILF